MTANQHLFVAPAVGDVTLLLNWICAIERSINVFPHTNATFQLPTNRQNLPKKFKICTQRGIVLIEVEAAHWARDKITP